MPSFISTAQVKGDQEASSPRRSRLVPRNRAVGRALAVAVGYATLRLSLALFHRMRRRFLRELLFDLLPTLDAAGATYWLDFGSLLGVHRDGDLILHDNDIDLAVLNPDWPRLVEHLEHHLEPKYRVKVVTPANNSASAWVRVYCPLGMADLFNAHDKGSPEVFVDCGQGDTMHVAKELVLPPSTLQWRGQRIPVPADVMGTLRRRYGDTWQTPVYMDKGADSVEGSKPYARVFRFLAKLGLRI